MATGFEVLGAVGTALQLVKLATNVVEFFSDMATGFNDMDGKIGRINRELKDFKESAKFAHLNLDHYQIDDLGLKQVLCQYESTISQLGRKMQKIHGRKWLWGKTKMWMQLMKSDSEVAMLREQLRQHTRELLTKFTAAALAHIKKDVKEIKKDVRGVQSDVRAHYEFSRSSHQSIMSSQNSSEENIKAFIDARLATLSITTPTLPPADLDDDGLFDFDSPPLSPLDTSPPDSPPLSPVNGSPVGSIAASTTAWCYGYLKRRDSTDTFAWCEEGSCYAHSVNSTTTSDGGHPFAPSSLPASLAS